MSGRRLTAAVAWIGFALALALAPRIFTSGSSHTALCLMAVAIVFALSYNMLLGQTGLLSFGHAVYYGLAGFAVIHVMNVIIAGKWPVPLVVMPLVGGVAGLVSAIFLGWVSTRRGGLVFSMITLGIGELVNSAALILHTFFGGEDGIETDRTGLAPFFGYKFGPQIQIYYLIAFWCFVSVVLMYAVTRTPLGRICNAVRDNPERAEFVGYDAKRVRYYAMCLSGFFAGVAGALSTMNFELTNASMMGATLSGNVLVMTFIGGAGYFWGPIVGAVLVTLLQFLLSDATQAWMLYFGLLFIFVVMFAPGGRRRLDPSPFRRGADRAAVDAGALLWAGGAGARPQLRRRRAADRADASSAAPASGRRTRHEHPASAFLRCLPGRLGRRRDRARPRPRRVAARLAEGERGLGARRRLARSGADMTFALSLTDVWKRFQTLAIIRGVTLDIPPGERHAIIGPNGAGKSTLFNLISGRFAPTSGEIRLNGARIDGSAAVSDQPARPGAKLPDHQYLPQPLGLREPALRRALVLRPQIQRLDRRRPPQGRRRNAPTRCWRTSA